jgi:hypothetical protein
MYVRPQAFKYIILLKIHVAFNVTFGTYADHSLIHHCAYDMQLLRNTVRPLVDYNASSNKFRVHPTLWFIACKLVVHQATRASSPRLVIHVVAHTSSYEQSTSYFTIQWQQEFMCSKSSLLARETAQSRHSLLTNEDILYDSMHLARIPNCMISGFLPRSVWGLDSSGMLRRVGR